MENKRSRRMAYYSMVDYTSKDDYNKKDDIYDKYTYNNDDRYIKDEYQGKEDFGNSNLYSRGDGGYGHDHGGGYGHDHGGGHGHGGGYQMTYHHKDLYSILAFTAFVLAIGYLIWYCIPDTTRCNGNPADKRKKRSADQSLTDVAREMDFVMGLIERAENVWKTI